MSRKRQPDAPLVRADLEREIDGGRSARQVSESNDETSSSSAADTEEAAPRKILRIVRKGAAIPDVVPEVKTVNAAEPRESVEAVSEEKSEATDECPSTAKKREWCEAEGEEGTDKTHRHTQETTSNKKTRVGAEVDHKDGATKEADTSSVTETNSASPSEQTVNVNAATADAEEASDIPREPKSNLEEADAAHESSSPVADDSSAGGEDAAAKDEAASKGGALTEKLNGAQEGAGGDGASAEPPRDFMSAFSSVTKSESGNSFLVPGSGTMPAADSFLANVPSVFGSSIFGHKAAASTGDATAVVDTDCFAPNAGDDVSGSGSSAHAPTPGARPSVFPGEEDEDQVFTAANVVLYKSVAIEKQPSAGGQETSEEDRKSTAAAAVKENDPAQQNGKSEGTPKGAPEVEHRFKKQGEGILRILAHKEKGSENKRRVVVRQKGTWKILLNSPTSVTKAFTKADQLSAGSGVKFIAYDGQEAGEEEKPRLSVFLLKFLTATDRSDFASAFGLALTDGTESR